MSKQEVIEAIFNKVVLSRPLENLNRNQIIKDYEDRVEVMYKKRGVPYLLRLDNISIQVNSTSGYCTGFAMTNIVHLKIPLDEIIQIFGEKHLSYSSTALISSSNDMLIICSKSASIRLEFINSDRTIGYYLQNLFYCHDEVTPKVLQASFTE